MKYKLFKQNIPNRIMTYCKNKSMAWFHGLLRNKQNMPHCGILIA
ncbi:MAG: hypothetical protein AB6733_15860 [Clostridiaceae bacterium]